MSEDPSVEIAQVLSDALEAVTGHGADQATVIRDEAAVVVLVKGTLTEREQELVSDGALPRADDIRAHFQEVVKERVRPLVESWTRRPVVALLNDHAISPDVGAYVFVLGTEGTPS